MMREAEEGGDGGESCKKVWWARGWLELVVMADRA